MMLAGTEVRIVAADDFFAYCDGWIGVVSGVNNGHIEVKCGRPDGVKTLYVPEAQLSPLKPRGFIGVAASNITFQ